MAGTAAQAADHAESPGSDADPAADIADVFVFRAADRPEGNRLLGAFTFSNRPAPRTRIDLGLYCDRNVLYTFNIDNNNDNQPDFQIFARLAPDSRDNCGLQLENVPGAGGTFPGSENSVFQSSTGLRAFLGPGDDPFFFDAQGFNATLASFGPRSTPSGQLRFSGSNNNGSNDSFAFRNASFIVFELDLDLIRPLPPRRRSASGARRPGLRGKRHDQNADSSCVHRLGPGAGHGTVRLQRQRPRAAGPFDFRSDAANLYFRIDRMGQPATGTALLSRMPGTADGDATNPFNKFNNQRDAFNRGNPDGDNANFLPLMAQTLQVIHVELAPAVRALGLTTCSTGEAGATESDAWIARARAQYLERLAAVPEAATGHALDHFLEHAAQEPQTLQLAQEGYRLRPYGACAIALAEAQVAHGRHAEAIESCNRPMVRAVTPHK